MGQESQKYIKILKKDKSILDIIIKSIFYVIILILKKGVDPNE